MRLRLVLLPELLTVLFSKLGGLGIAVEMSTWGLGKVGEGGMLTRVGEVNISRLSGSLEWGLLVGRRACDYGVACSRNPVLFPVIRLRHVCTSFLFH